MLPNDACPTLDVSPFHIKPEFASFEVRKKATARNSSNLTLKSTHAAKLDKLHRIQAGMFVLIRAIRATAAAVAKVQQIHTAVET